MRRPRRGRGVTLAGAAALALALPGGPAVTPAAASFHYVPPAEAAAGIAAADRAAGPPGAPGPAAGGPSAAGAWGVDDGEMLGDVLERWGARAGVAVLVLTDRRWRLDRARAFDGSFGDAVGALLAALSHLPEAPVGELSGDGRALVVLHRPAGDGP